MNLFWSVVWASWIGLTLITLASINEAVNRGITDLWGGNCYWPASFFGIAWVAASDKLFGWNP